MKQLPSQPGLWDQPAQAAKTEGRARAARGHEPDIQRLIPLAQEVARRAGVHGVTVGDIRLVAQRQGLLTQANVGRGLSWLTALPKRAGLVATGHRRLSPLPKSRNDHMVYTLPEFAP